MAERTPKPVVWGWILTAGVFVLAVVMGFGPICDNGTCQSKFAAFWSAPPNEIGDTLAGFAGALAFVWIIVTVLLQSAELRAQREELKLTRAEMEAQRKATEELAQNSKVQADIFEKEQKQREQEVYRDIVEQKLVGVWYRMTTMPLSFVSWLIPESCFEDLDFEEFAHLFKLPETDDINRLEKPESPAERDSQLRLQAYHLRELINKLDDCATLLPKDQLPEKPSEFGDLLVEIRMVIELEKFLSEAQRERLRNIQLNETFIELQKVSERSELWSSAGAGK